MMHCVESYLECSYFVCLMVAPYQIASASLVRHGRQITPPSISPRILRSTQYSPLEYRDKPVAALLDLDPPLGGGRWLDEGLLWDSESFLLNISLMSRFGPAYSTPIGSFGSSICFSPFEWNRALIASSTRAINPDPTTTSERSFCERIIVSSAIHIEHGEIQPPLRNSS